MTPATPYALVFLAVAITFIILANLAMYAMVGQVNARLGENERFSFAGFHFAKNRRIAERYKELYPRGLLLWSYRICIFFSILFMALAAYNDR